jgi:hypothetical protein
MSIGDCSAAAVDDVCVDGRCRVLLVRRWCVQKTRDLRKYLNEYVITV